MSEAQGAARTAGLAKLNARQEQAQSFVYSPNSYGVLAADEEMDDDEMVVPDDMHIKSLSRAQPRAAVQRPAVGETLPCVLLSAGCVDACMCGHIYNNKEYRGHRRFEISRRP